MSRSRACVYGVRLLISNGIMQRTELGLKQLANIAMQGEVLSAAPLTWSSVVMTQQQQLPFAARSFAAAASGKDRKRGNKSSSDQGIVAAEEEFSAITDKIPQRPMTAVEGTSYTVVIIAALGFAAAVIYAALNELLFAPKEYQCYTQTVNKLKDDPRINVRLGSPVSAYGTESRNRAARQRIPHRIYNDDQGREHLQLQFHLKGPSGRATVNADMYHEGKEWKYHYMYLDVESPFHQQVVLIRPGQVDEY